ncbi:hypothetical protein J6590_091418 [Homalodisca vitripennis]|nr:hypothetical protein J6590_091418 [Homalodisca vitripennis]
MAAHNVLHNVYLKQPAISDWINLLRCGLRHSTLLKSCFYLKKIGQIQQVVNPRAERSQQVNQLANNSSTILKENLRIP